jgi:uncharacterized protein YbcI
VLERGEPSTIAAGTAAPGGSRGTNGIRAGAASVSEPEAPLVDKAVDREGCALSEDRFGTPMERGKLAAAISNAIVGLFREHYGRGASRARTVMGADYVITFLEDIYTPVEKTLIEAGRFAAVQETRGAFQDTMKPKFVAEVERLVGRKVVGFLSQVHVDPDLAVETFILEPLPAS